MDAVLVLIKSKVGKRVVNCNNGYDIKLALNIEIDERVMALQGKVAEEHLGLHLLLCIVEVHHVD